MIRPVFCNIHIRRMMRILLCAVMLYAQFPVLHLNAQGLPLIRNYTAAEYGAHNHNFDIEIGQDGTVFVANFEGLLYYDRAQWRIIHTPDINRITVVCRTSDDIIWVGGYNFFARLQRKANGELFMQRIGKPGLFKGEIMEIFESDGTVQFIASDNNIYEVKGNDATLKKHTSTNFRPGLESDIVSIEAVNEGATDAILTDITQTEQLDGGLQVKVKRNFGLIITDNSGKELYTITEANGLCSDQVAYVAYDGHGILWGATSHGIFSIEMSALYTYLLPKDGLTGDIHAIMPFNGKMYVGGSNGVYTIGKFPSLVEPVKEINGICWAFCLAPQGLLAATSSGTYIIGTGGGIRKMSDKSTMSLLTDVNRIYAGEHDGVYLYIGNQTPRKVSDLNQVSKILKDRQGSIYIQNIFGEVFRKLPTEDTFKPLSESKNGTPVAKTIVSVGDEVKVVSALDTQPFPYPTFSYTDVTGMTWLTDNEACGLHQWKNGKRVTELDHLLHPFSTMSVGALYRQDEKLWIGGDDKLVIVDTSKMGVDSLTAHPQLLFRSIVLGADSVLWGGYGNMMDLQFKLSSDERHLRFVFGVDHAPLTGMTLYRYRLNNAPWGNWSEKQEVEFLNLPYGSYTIEIQAKLTNGELSKVESVSFTIAYPFFMRWYMVIFYLLLVALLVYGMFRYRLKRLEKDKIKLERIVQERTADLLDAQHELIRQEKMATVGKLTEGLIDRILNPMNYIINFSKMSNDLLKDLKVNIEGNKDNMDKEDYEDSADILNMLTQNLQSVDQYGQNTTRILKAMEEMLKDRTGGYVDMDLLPVLQQDEKMLGQYYAKEKEQHHIQVSFTLPDNAMKIHGNGDMLSKTVMSLLGNAIYAVGKKAQKTQYAPEVSLTATTDAGQYIIKIRDNGIGIEEKILGKIFDPFFTTKTSDEAAGVGLFLSREIIQNHGGDISVASVKDEYTEFTITLPAAAGLKSNEQ